MAHTLNLLAFDLGASNGRAMLGRFDGERLQMEPLHRFANNYVYSDGGMYWDTSRLLQEIKNSLRLAAGTGNALDGIALDGWGLDFGLLDKAGRLCQSPRCYRDPRSMRGAELLRRDFNPWELYQHTGCTLLAGSSLSQLYAMATEQAPELKQAESLLLMPDLLSYFLCGEQAAEYTNATTTQLYAPLSGDWAFTLIQKLGIPSKLFPRIVSPGERRGLLTGDMRRETGLGAVPLLFAASHDTASALAAVPKAEENFAFLSSGTWSLIGLESQTPQLSQKAFSLGFSNEGAASGGFRLMKNVHGLWLLQECGREWAQGRPDGIFWQALTEQAEKAPAFLSLIPPAHPYFFGPGNMCARIQRFCALTGQTVPQTPGEFTRCILESLALSYQEALEDCDSLRGSRIERLYIVGGGSQNRLLNYFAACATGRPVTSGPAEASSAGNLLVQAQALGALRGQEQMAEVIRRSFSLEGFEPENVELWSEIGYRFRALGKYKIITEND